MSKDWWDTGDDMFNRNYSPFDELNNLRAETVNQRATITQLVNHNNKLQDLMVELSDHHRTLTANYSAVNQRLNQLQNELYEIKKKTIVLTNDIESDL